MAYFKCSGGGSTKPNKDDYLIYKWDFTKSLVDEVNNLPLYANPSGMQPSNNGLVFTDEYIGISLGQNEGFVGKMFEIDFGTVALGTDVTASSAQNLIRINTQGTNIFTNPLLYDISEQCRAYGMSKDNYSNMGYTAPYICHSSKRSREDWEKALSNKTLSFAFPNECSFFAWQETAPLLGYYTYTVNGSINIICGSVNLERTNNIKTYPRIVDSYSNIMYLGDERSNRRGLYGCEIKGVRVYSQMIMDNPEIWITPINVNTQGGD